MQLAWSLRASGNQPEIERKRERERRTWGSKSLVEQGCFTELCVSIYTVLQGNTSSDKDQKTWHYKLSRKQGATGTIKPKGNPYQKRVIDNPFYHMQKLMKEILGKHPNSMISVLGVACPSSGSWQELIRNRGLKQDRKQHTEPYC